MLDHRITAYMFHVKSLEVRTAKCSDGVADVTFVDTDGNTIIQFTVFGDKPISVSVEERGF